MVAADACHTAVLKRLKVYDRIDTHCYPTACIFVAEDWSKGLQIFFRKILSLASSTKPNNLELELKLFTTSCSLPTYPTCYICCT